MSIEIEEGEDFSDKGLENYGRLESLMEVQVQYVAQ